MKAYTRATTFNRALSDNRALELWRGRMVAKGIALRDDLRARAAAAKVEDRDTLNEVAEAALEAAKGSTGRNLGSALHQFVEQVNAGETPDVPSDWKADVDAYVKCLADAGLSVVPGMCERVTCVDGLDVAGTFDMIVTDGTNHWIADLKTSPNVHYGFGEIAVQLAIYAQGVNTAGVLTKGKFDEGYERDRWGRYRLPVPPDPRWQPAPQVEVDRAVVVHLPPGQGECHLIWLDITRGWEAAQLCYQVRSWRSGTKTLAVSPPFLRPVAAPPEDEPRVVFCPEPRRLDLIARLRTLDPVVVEEVVARCHDQGIRLPKKQAAVFRTCDADAIDQLINRIQQAAGVPA